MQARHAKHAVSSRQAMRMAIATNLFAYGYKVTERSADWHERYGHH